MTSAPSGVPTQAALSGHPNVHPSPPRPWVSRIASASEASHAAWSTITPAKVRTRWRSTRKRPVDHAVANSAPPSSAVHVRWPKGASAARFISVSRMLMTARSPLLSMRARSAYPALSNAREAGAEVRGHRVGQQPDLDPGAEHDPRRAAGEEAEQQDLDGQVRLPRATEDEEDRAHRDEE